MISSAAFKNALQRTWLWLHGPRRANVLCYNPTPVLPPPIFDPNTTTAVPAHVKGRVPSVEKLARVADPAFQAGFKKAADGTLKESIVAEVKEFVNSSRKRRHTEKVVDYTKTPLEAAKATSKKIYDVHLQGSSC